MRNLGSKAFVFLIAAIVVAGLGYAFLPQPVEVDLVEVGAVRHRSSAVGPARHGRAAGQPMRECRPLPPNASRDTS